MRGTGRASPVDSDLRVGTDSPRFVAYLAQHPGDVLLHELDATRALVTHLMRAAERGADPERVTRGQQLLLRLELEREVARLQALLDGRLSRAGCRAQHEQQADRRSHRECAQSPSQERREQR